MIVKGRQCLNLNMVLLVKKKEYYYSEIMIMIERKNQIKPPFHTVKAATLAPAIL